ncbi:MAG TPA: ferritin family protein [Syntrophomonadaceae bacterium]|nr:ferritin family protein [Syntrophomonadaceae bacterium]
MWAKKYDQIIQHAISSETESYEFYFAVYRRLENLEMKRLFKNLAEEELEHRNILQGFMDNRTFPELATPLEWPSLDAPPAPLLSTLMKPMDAIALAIQKEADAQRDYMHMGALSQDLRQKRIFDRLALMEQGHKTRLQEIFDNGLLPEAW